MSARAARSSRGSDPPNSGETTAPERQGERRLISPFRCRIWTQHSRPEEELTAEACQSLRESIAKHGQHQAALARPVTNDPDYAVEIICGARRHAAALALGRDLLVELRPLTDAQAYVAMYEENLEREDDSPYVHGQILWRARLSGTYTSQEDLARAFRLSHSRVSRLLMLAQLPSIVVATFHRPHDIRESWGVDLYQRCTHHDPQHAITARARALMARAGSLSARQVYEALITGPADTPPTPRSSRSTPVRGSRATALFREQERLHSVTYIVPRQLLDDDRRHALRQAIVQVLDGSPGSPHDPAPGSRWSARHSADPRPGSPNAPSPS